MDIQQGFTKDLPAKLTPEEIENRSRQLARQIESIADVEEEKAKTARQFGEKLKGMRLLAMTLAHAVSSGEESRPVLCSERADYRRFCIETYRHDTSEVVETRAMEADEVEEARQGHLSFVRVADDYEKDKVEAATGKRPGSGLDLESPAITPAKSSRKKKDEPEQFGSQLKEAIEGLKATNPGGTIEAGWAGGPMTMISDTTPETLAKKAAEEAAAEPDDGTEITAPTSILEGKIAKKRRESKAVKLAGGFSAGLAAAEAERNAALLAAEEAEELPPIEGVEGVEGAEAAEAHADANYDRDLARIEHESSDDDDGESDDGEEPADDGG